MGIAFIDQVAAFLAMPANQGQFATTVGLGAFATTAYTKRYSQGGFQVNSVTLGAPANFQIQQSLNGETRLSGFREKRSEQPQRHWYEIRLLRETQGWVDATFNVPVQFTLQMMPGSIPLGSGGGVTQAGVSDPALLTHNLQFLLPVTTDTFTASYEASVYVFAATDPSPVADLRRILALRQALEDDAQFLVSLDGSADQRPYLFVQLYPAGVLTGPPLSQAGVVATFAAADILASFITVPAI
jgi:hypothetical protein